MAVILSYLYGSIPFIEFLARARNIDLTVSGSGNVGATNLAASAGGAVAAVGWIADASKGLLPVLVARTLSRNERDASLCGAAGVAGQCWPIFLRFRGGRGIAPFVGAALAIDRVAWLVAILPMITGGLWRQISPTTTGREKTRSSPRSRSVPLGALGGILVFPAACALRRRPLSGPLLISAVLLARRLTAPLPDDATSGPRANPRALFYRFLYDRNTSR